MFSLGLDVGISSIGFALINQNNKQLKCSGVHTFDVAEVSKTGESLAKSRRTARGQRRVIRRRAQRKQHIRKLLQQHNVVLPVEPSSFYELIDASKSPWQLRAEGLTRRLTDQEFARVLLHLSKHRGFKSNRKQDSSSDDESKKMLKAISELKTDMEVSEHKTIGSYLASLNQQRNHKQEYRFTALRSLVEEEAQQLFRAQRQWQHPLAAEAFEIEYNRIAFFQRPLKPVYDLVGYCSLELDEKRAPRFSRSGELFVLWQKINHIRLDFTDGTERKLTDDERQALFIKCHEIKKVCFSHLRKIVQQISQPEVDFFIRGVNYSQTKKSTKEKDKDKKAPAALVILDYETIIQEAEKKSFASLEGFHALNEAFAVNHTTLHTIDSSLWDKVATILSFEHDDKAIDEALETLKDKLTPSQRKTLSHITSFKGVLGHSCKAIGNMLPHLEAGETYDQAVALAGYSLHKTNQEKNKKLPRFEDVRNPVVNRALAQCRKVINSIIARHGMPDMVHIELAREVGKSFKERKKIKTNQNENRAQKEALRKEMLNTLGEDIGLDKYRFWKEQKGICVYSGKAIVHAHLKDATSIQIDHILPFSASFDNSLNNKVLVFTGENQNKGKRTPWEYFQAAKGVVTEQDEAWQIFEATIKHLPWPKRKRLLMKNFDQHLAETWKERHLKDTQYIARVLKNHIETYLDFSSSEIERKRRVVVVSGRITSFLRWQWGLEKNRAESNRHHALDACVIACTTFGMVQQVTDHYKGYQRARNLSTPQPWEGFREQVLESVADIFVSRLPNRKMSSKLHDDTLLRVSTAPNGDKTGYKKVALQSVKLATLEKLRDKERNAAVYQVIKERLEMHADDPKKAFKEPVYMPTKSGQQGPEIRSIVVTDDVKSGMPIRDGWAGNGTIVRTDVFEKAGKFYLCPVYPWHVYHQILPNKVVKGKTPEENWPVISPDYTFKFSLFPNDLVCLTDAHNTQTWGYYRGMDRSNGAISIISHDCPSAENLQRPGIQRMKAFDKYIVNYFGERFQVKQETRLGLANPSRSKSRRTNKAK